MKTRNKTRDRSPRFVQVNLSDQLPGWNVALERTRGLAALRLGYDGNIYNLCANAYLQGIMDFAFNRHLIDAACVMHRQEEGVDENYHGA